MEILFCPEKRILELWHLMERIYEMDDDISRRGVNLTASE